MATNQVKPTDVTGRSRAAAAKEFAEEQNARAAEMSLATAKKAEELDGVVDATQPNRQTVIVDNPTKVGESDDTVIIRVIADVEHMTLGAGNTYSFKAGQKYEVSRGVAQHLEEKGYLAGVI